MKTGVVLVGHGSKMPGFAAPMEKVARTLRAEKRYFSVVCAYLEISKPSIKEAVRQLARRGCRDIRVLPYFLLNGLHVVKDIPEIIRHARRMHRGVRVGLCPYLGYHEKIVSAVKDRLREVRS